MIAAVCAAVAAGTVSYLLSAGGCRAYAPPPAAFQGDSSALERTVIVPTLDTPLPEGRNALWCASFEMAWKALARDVVKAPVTVKGAEEVAARLNASALAGADLPEGGWYSAAGFVRDGIVESIRAEMAERFPGAPPPEFDGVLPDWIVAYAFLAASAEFTIPFFENDGLVFTDSGGSRTGVGSFGIRREDHDNYFDLRRQVEVLHWTPDTRDRRSGPVEFAVDPCRNSAPNQVILARVERKETLAATLADLERKAAAYPEDDWSRGLGPTETLLVPNMRFRIEHRFRELEGMNRQIMNPGFEGYWIALAAQTIDFRLDRCGAKLETEAKVFAGCEPRHFVFDRPFLVVMKRRGAGRPFLVMWVENAELLSK